MKQEATRVETFRCNLMITNKARKGIQEWSNDEHAFFKIQDSFDVHIEKRPINAHGNTSLTLYFDNGTNEVIAQKLDGKVAVMECILQNDGLLATGFHVRGSRVPVKTNRRLPANLKFVTARNNGAGMPIQLHTKIRELPVAEERSEYVKKRISSWEGYLKVQERNATIDDISASYSRLALNEDFSRLTLIDCNLNGNEWNKVKGLSVTLRGFQNDVGDVLKVNRGTKTVEIELKPKFREMARRNQWHPKSKDAVFSNFATLSQIRRLRKGFEDLQNGLAANANLEKILFEDRPTIRIPSKRAKLEFHNQLNEFQQEAVVGAMSAEDLYVIQGPPGTGKTTVISEICQQNAKAGLRTLVASQSNLAVDNALSRLLSNKDIRILRFGRTESIEEEGKKFIEENVGQYWKDQTLSVLQEVIEGHSERKSQIEQEVVSCEEQSLLLQQQLVSLEEKIELKEAAKKERVVKIDEIKNLKKSLVQLKKEREKLEGNILTLKNASSKLMNEINSIEQFIQTNLTSQELIEKMGQLGEEMDRTRQSIGFQQTKLEIRNLEDSLTTIRSEYQQAQVKKRHLEEFIYEIPPIKKRGELKTRMLHYEVTPHANLEQRITKLNQISDNLNSFNEWAELNKRLLSAIDYMESLLKENGVQIETIRNNVKQSGVVFHSSYSAKEIHQFMDRMKQLLTSDKPANQIERLSVFLEGLYVRRDYVWQQGRSLQQIQKDKAESVTLFEEIKNELIEQISKSITEIDQYRSELKNTGIIQNNQLAQLQDRRESHLSQIGPVESIPELNDLKSELLLKEHTYKDLQKSQETLKQYVQQLEIKKNDAKYTLGQIEMYEADLEEKEQDSKKVNSQGLEQEKQLKAIEELINQHPEIEHEKTLVEISTLSEKVEKITLEKKRLPITQALQNEWFSLLKEASDYDLDEIRKLYVRHANVIGTTCVASARKEFMENYPTFDVVIIDEVSKATPPELLLPMLKGKKIILVGDHHQLPPLVGEDTIDESLQAILEESDSLEEKGELKKLLKESLFERLFKNLPKSNKTMLAIQYRMHESIMETITPFYEEENYRLQCGLSDSDTMRDHLLESQYVNRNDHLLWLDMPNEKAYFEEQMKDGKSRFNQAELTTIREVLIDLDQATENAKNEGRMKQDERKSIGVISFYGEQVKKIDRLIQQELNLKHITFRTGTVDKFQGMEMDVIVLSMVRNNRDKSGDIGFANDYRRLNVALSRARELLIIVGSTQMFTERAKKVESRKMYSRLLGIVKDKKALRDPKGNIKK